MCFSGNDAVKMCDLTSFSAVDFDWLTLSPVVFVLLLSLALSLSCIVDCEQNNTLTCIDGAMKRRFVFSLFSKHVCCGNTVTSPTRCDKHQDFSTLGCTQLTHMNCSDFSGTPYAARWDCCSSAVFKICCAKFPTCVRIDVGGSTLSIEIGIDSIAKTDTTRGGTQIAFAGMALFLPCIAHLFVNTLFTFGVRCFYCVLKIITKNYCINRVRYSLSKYYAGITIIFGDTSAHTVPVRSTRLYTCSCVTATCKHTALCCYTAVW